MPTPRPIVCLIVAVAENGVVGRAGRMPWHLPSELRYFRARTLGKPMIMGRKTYQSIGKPLPGRDTIVVTADRDFRPPGVTVAENFDAALAAARIAAGARGAAEIVVAGGGTIYAQALPLAGRIYMTRIDARPKGDTYFPPLDLDQWRLASRRPLEQPPDERPTAMLEVYDRVGGGDVPDASL